MPVIEFQFEVGDQEHHQVSVRFNRSLGQLTISVDGQPVVRKLEMFSISTTKRYQFSVGENERHEVVIEKTRKRILGGFQPQTCTAYVDGQEVSRHRG